MAAEQNDNLIFKTGFDNLDMEHIHRCLSQESYWAKDIPFETVETAFRNSFCVALFLDDRQVAFARLISDQATFAYLADVFVDSGFRKQSLGKQMVEFIMKQDWIKGLRRIMLATSDAQDLYKKYGFVNLANPDNLLEITRPNMYVKNEEL